MAKLNSKVSNGEVLSWKVLDMQGIEVDKIDLDPEVFAAPIKANLVHETVRWQLNKRRAGTHQALTRTLKEGGAKKPFKQKGTGRARAGSSISPLWVGGASIHGPLPRSYEHKLAKRTRRQAMASVLSAKIKSQSIVVLSNLDIPSGKTKDMAKVLGAVGVAGTKSMLLLSSPDSKVEQSAKNIDRLVLANVAGANVYDLMRTKFLVTTKDSILALQARVKAD